MGAHEEEEGQGVLHQALAVPLLAFQPGHGGILRAKLIMGYIFFQKDWFFLLAPT